MENRKIERIGNNFKGNAKIGYCVVCGKPCNHRVFTSTQQYGFKMHEECVEQMFDNVGEKTPQGKECKYDSFKFSIVLLQTEKIASVIYKDFSYLNTKKVNSSHFKAVAYYNNSRSLVRFLENCENEKIGSTCIVEYYGKTYKMVAENVNDIMECIDLIRRVDTLKDGLPKTKVLARIKELTI